MTRLAACTPEDGKKLTNLCCMLMMACRDAIFFKTYGSLNEPQTAPTIDSSRLTPAEWDGAWTIGAFLDQRLVILATGTGMNGGPAVFAVVLERDLFGFS